MLKLDFAMKLKEGKNRFQLQQVIKVKNTYNFDYCKTTEIIHLLFLI